MKFILSFTLIATFTAITLSSVAQAEIVSAGTPAEVRVEADPGFRFADIYQRQLDYGETSKLLRDDMLERQKNFAAPSIEAQQQHRQDLKDLHGQTQ